MTTLPDADARARALDPGLSCIVQAPAGSGKTGLLIRRFLTLLARVEMPEEIVAITFTRKAAAEMRDRVLGALSGESGDADVQRLASAAARRDALLGWELARNPSRLRIMTIDGFCLALTRQMPWTSGFGAPPGMADEPATLYRQAARDTIALIDSPQRRHATALKRLLLHFDNRFQTVESMLVQMFARRDQWADEIVQQGGGDTLRGELEDTLQCIVDAGIDRLTTLMPGPVFADVLHCARGAGLWLQANEPGHPLCALAALDEAAIIKDLDLESWQLLVNFLLTGGSAGGTRTLRKPGGVNKRIGFPADKSDTSQARKNRFKAVLEDLAQERYEPLVGQLAETARLPAARFDDDQWDVLDALITVLPVALAQLRLVFIANGEVDFIEVQLRARDALGQEGSPTDLALSLDYRISHILIDEFQDTSTSQEDLVRRLTAGWADGDGRTLFVVGDPMQSIYRFRKADVGLFVHAMAHGIGHLPLEALELAVNFRSDPGIIEWVNDSFSQIMPPVADALEGAVPLRPSLPAPDRAPGGTPAVSVLPFWSHERDEEADQVVTLVQEFLTTADPAATLAILVRARTHADSIVPRLHEAGIAFQGKDLETLGSQSVVQDLIALVRLLLHPADRIAWLSVLRAPYCGLTLADLSILVERDRERSLLNIVESGDFHGLSDDGRVRLERIRGSLVSAVAERRRGTLRRAVEKLWIALDGPACIDARGLHDARTLLELVAHVEVGSDIADLDALNKEVDKLYAAPDLSSDRVHVMTIHMSKGLEFDTVILPGLGRRPRGRGQQLLSLAEVNVASAGDCAMAEQRVLLSPPPATGADGDPLYSWLNRLEATRGQFETARLLYVACTRAERRLYLLGGATCSAKSGIRAAPGSLLETLWPVVEHEFAALEAPEEDGDEDMNALDTGDMTGVRLRRLHTDWTSPAAVESLDVVTDPDLDQAFEAVEFSWAGENARQTGIVVHAALMKIAGDGVGSWNPARLDQERLKWKADLKRCGIVDEQLDATLDRVDRAVRQAIASESGRWILDSAHTDAHNEYPLTGVINGSPRQIVVDRTFIDSDGVRWIIDYKTGDHGGGDRAAFLAEERKRYTPQLERYARILARRDAAAAGGVQCSSGKVKVALYYPLLGELIAWTPAID